MREAPEPAHPTDSTLQDFGQGKLDATSAGSVERHVKSCSACTRRVEELTGVGAHSRGVDSRGSGRTRRRPGAGPASPSADAVPDDLVGLPGYEVIRELGRGGMGVVYLARNKLMGRLEVLKVVGGHLVDKPIVLDRFLREIQSAAKLQHQNIVTAYSAMQVGRSVVLAMEYVEGEDLSQLVKSRGPLPVTNACYYIYQAALGLQHAHERGMVHRDIKPANLILAREGKKAVVKVLDFGLAKVTSEGQVDTGLTREGQMLGTPDYIAPEQTLDAQKADIRADIYSLGCTFYYLLTGGPPFRGKSLYDLLQAHHSMDAQPLNLVRPDVSSELAALVAKMLAKDPAQRFQTPGAVAQALSRFIKPGSGPPAGSSAETAAVARPVAPGPAFGVSAPVRPAEGARAKTVVEGGDWNGLIAVGEKERSGPGSGRKTRHAEPGAGGRSLPLIAAGVVAAVAAAGVFYATRRSTPDAVATAPGPAPRAARKPTAEAPPAPRPERPPAPEPVAAREPEAPARTAAVESVESPPNHDARGVVKSAETAAGTVKIADPARAEAAEGVGAALLPEFRRLKADAGLTHLTDKTSRQPPGPFWPALTPANVQAWQIADPGAVKMTEKGLFVSAGPAGNFLLTRRSDYRKVSVKIGLAASRGTEAFLALHAVDGPGGWHAVTSQVVDDGGTVRAGLQGADFQPEDPGAGRTGFPPDKYFRVAFEDNGRGTLRVLVNGKETSAVSAGPGQYDDRAGAAGLFVKSGSVKIDSITIE